MKEKSSFDLNAQNGVFPVSRKNISFGNFDFSELQSKVVLKLAINESIWL